MKRKWRGPTASSHHINCSSPRMQFGVVVHTAQWSPTAVTCSKWNRMRVFFHRMAFPLTSASKYSDQSTRWVVAAQEREKEEKYYPLFYLPAVCFYHPLHWTHIHWWCNNQNVCHQPSHQAIIIHESRWGSMRCVCNIWIETGTISSSSRSTSWWLYRPVEYDESWRRRRQSW